MKAVLQAGLSGQAPAPPEKRFLITERTMRWMDNVAGFTVMVWMVANVVGAYGQETGEQGETTPPAANPRGITEASSGMGTGGAARDWYAPVKNVPLGQGKLDLGFNLRARYEFTDNFNVRGYGTETDDNLLLLRMRASLGYTFTDEASAYLELQDARYWLSDLDRDLWPENCPFYDELDVRQAYLEWKRIDGSPLGFKAGRQIIRYADSRVFGPGEWGNAGRYGWDAVKLYIDTAPVQLDLLYGRRVTSENSQFNDEHYPFHMFGCYAQVKKQAWDEISVKPDAFYIVQYDHHGHTAGESGQGDQETHSLGLYVDAAYGHGWDFSGTLAGQAGEYGRDDIRAYGYNVKAGHTWESVWQPRLGGEFNYASGDGNTNDGRHATFDGMFGAVDAFYGRMNFFSWMNIEDYQATFSVKPRKDLKLWCDYHLFRLAEASDAWYWASGRPARRDATGNAGRDVGQEVDLLAQWQVDKNTEVMTGWAHFYPGEFIENTSGSEADADWWFVQGTYKF